MSVAGFRVQTTLRVPKRCCIEECDNTATVGSWCDQCWQVYQSLEASFEREAQWDQARERRRFVLYRRRAQRRKQFFGALIVMLMGEGLWNYALAVPMNFRTVGMSLGWAFAVATVAGLIHGRKSVRSGAKERKS
jgi:hypothetical protein